MSLLLWNRKFHCRIHKSCALTSLQCEINPVHSQNYFFQISFNIIRIPVCYPRGLTLSGFQVKILCTFSISSTHATFHGNPSNNDKVYSKYLQEMYHYTGTSRVHSQKELRDRHGWSGLPHLSAAMMNEYWASPEWWMAGKNQVGPDRRKTSLMPVYSRYKIVLKSNTRLCNYFEAAIFL